MRARSSSVRCRPGRSGSASALDCEGRPYDSERVVVNFNNVGTTFGKQFTASGKFHWEGVRRCVKHLVAELRLKVTGVIYETWKAADGNLEDIRTVGGIPEDIRAMCEHCMETPRAAGEHQKGADDETTIKCAYRRNCKYLDNDNYKDWIHVLKDEKMRAWLVHSQTRFHMKYYFDPALGCFETLDGNVDPNTGQVFDKAQFGKGEGKGKGKASWSRTADGEERTPQGAQVCDDCGVASPRGAWGGQRQRWYCSECWRRWGYPEV